MKKAPVLNNRDFKICLKFFRACLSLDQPELFSWLFYVAASRLNSPRLSSLLIRPARSACQVYLWWFAAQYVDDLVHRQQSIMDGVGVNSQHVRQ